MSEWTSGDQRRCRSSARVHRPLGASVRLTERMPGDGLRRGSGRMLDASGRYRFRYEDVFRALGNYIDANLFKDVSIVETPEGFLIKGQVVQSTSSGYASQPATYL